MPACFLPRLRAKALRKRPCTIFLLMGWLVTSATLDQAIQLAVRFESLLQENQAHLDTPVQAPSPVAVWAQHPALALSKVRLKPLRRLLGPRPRGSLRAAVSLMTHAWLEAPAPGLPLCRPAPALPLSRPTPAHLLSRPDPALPLSRPAPAHPLPRLLLLSGPRPTPAPVWAPANSCSL